MAASVVAKAPGQVIHPHFFAQPVRSVVGKAVGCTVLVDQCGQAQGLVVLVTDPLALGVLAAARQAARGALQAGGLAFAIGMRQHLAEGVVGEAFGSAIRVMDAQHFTVGFAFQRSGLVQRIGHRDQVLAFVVAVPGALARAVLEALDLGVGVPPQVLGLEVGIDDRVRQAVIAVEVLSLVAQRVDLGDQVAFVVVARLPHAAVGESGFGDQWRGEVMFVADLAAQRVGFLDQPREFIVFERQAIAVGQLDANEIAGGVQVHAIAFTAKVTAGDDAIVLVVLDLQFTAQHVSCPAGSLGEVVTEVIVLAVAGPVLDYARFTALGFPAVFADQAQGIAVAGHEVFGIAEMAYRIAVAVDYFSELAVIVVPVTHQRFDGAFTDHPLDVGKATERIVVVQVNANGPWCSDVRQATVSTAGEVKIVAQCIFQALQRDARIVIRHFAKVEKDVVERLQDIMPALGAHEVYMLMRVVDAFARFQVDERNTAALIVGVIDKAATTAQALLPRQYPALPQSTLSGEVTGIETRPFDRHQAWQNEVCLIVHNLSVWPRSLPKHLSTCANRRFIGKIKSATLTSKVAPLIIIFLKSKNSKHAIQFSMLLQEFFD